MGQQEPQPQDLLSTWKQRANVLCNVCRIVSFPVAVWTTRLGTWGGRFVGPFEALGLLWPPLLAAFFAGDRQAAVLFDAWWLTLGLAVLRPAVPEQEVVPAPAFL